MQKWEADFEAMNRKAGEGLRVMRKGAGMSREVLASYLQMTVDELRQREQGHIPIEAACLYFAEMLLKAGGFNFYFHPYDCLERFSNPMKNVIRFPSLATIAGIVE